MKLTANREGLLTAFSLAASVVNQRSPKPILQNVKLSLSESYAKLDATDGEISVAYEVSGVESKDRGESLIPPTFASILKELDDERIELHLDNVATVKGSSAKFELPTADANEFPSPAEINGSEHRISAANLATLIRRTSFAVASENSRYALGSVLLEFDGVARMVATDGKRLALMEVPGSGTSEGTILLNPKSLAIVSKILVDPDAEIVLRLSKDSASFSTGKATVTTRLVEGRFPRYQDVFPPQPKHSILLTVGPLARVMRQAKILATEDSKGVEFAFGERELRLSSKSGSGSSDVTLPIGSDAEVSITFDPQFLIDACRVLDAESEITLDLIDGKRAGVLRTGDYRYVVMPLTREKA